MVHTLNWKQLILGVPLRLFVENPKWHFFFSTYPLGSYQAYSTLRESWPRRETVKGLKNHHTCFRWVYSFCIASLSGRWSITALRGLCPLVLCYARSRPCRDESLFFTISLSASCKRRLPTSGIRFLKSEKNAKFTFSKVKKDAKNYVSKHWFWIKISVCKHYFCH